MLEIAFIFLSLLGYRNLAFAEMRWMPSAVAAYNTDEGTQHVLPPNDTGHAGGASGPTIIPDATAASRAPVCSA
jgi:hypothetical protein